MEVVVRSIDGSGFFGIDLDENGQLGADALQTGGDRTLASYTKTFIKSAMDPRLLNALGQFAQDYLVIPCGHCRQYFLLFAPVSSPQADYAIKCPWCAVSIRSWVDGGRYLVNSNISAAEFLCEDDILSLVATWPAQKHISSAPERVRIQMTGREFRIVR
jgi:hypothetical protein